MATVFFSEKSISQVAWWQKNIVATLQKMHLSAELSGKCADILGGSLT